MAGSNTALDPLANVAGDRLVVAITARALFDLEATHAVFEGEGLEAYAKHQRARENEVLEPGIAFPLVRKLLALNEGAPPEAPRVEVILISRNSADTGLRIFNSIAHHGLAIKRAAFSNGAAPYPYIRPFGADLFLSTHGGLQGRCRTRSCLLRRRCSVSMAEDEYAHRACEAAHGLGSAEHGLHLMAPPESDGRRRKMHQRRLRGCKNQLPSVGVAPTAKGSTTSVTLQAKPRRASTNTTGSPSAFFTVAVKREGDSNA